MPGTKGEHAPTRVAISTRQMRSKGAGVSRFGRMFAVVLSCSVVMAGSAGAVVAQKQKKVTAAKYAKTVCSTYTKVKSSISDFADEYNSNTSEDPAAIQSDTLELANGLLDEFATQQKKLKKVYPDIDGGKKTARLFAANIGELSDKFKESVDKFQAADPTNPAFVGDVTQFEVAFGILDVGLSDPFSQVHDQDLLKAFDGEKSCKDVVTVFGA